MLRAAEPADTRTVQVAYPPASVAWYATGILALLYWVSILDRFIISLLVEPIKSDLGITDVQFSLLTGVAFSITFSAFGLLLGALADRFNRRWIIYVGVTVWSVATAVCGVVQHFWQILVARVGVGVGEAALTPCASSMLSDLFPREKLTTAVAVYSMGATIGSGCAFIFGGLIVELVSHTKEIAVPLLGTLRSWQTVFFMVGIPGTLLAFLIFTVPEPIRRGRMRAPSPLSWSKSYGELLQFMGARRRFFACHYTAFGLAAAVITAGGTWYPAHMSRVFGWSPSKVGLSVGLIMVIAGTLSQVLAGRVVDTLFNRGRRDAHLRYAALVMAISLPIGVIALTSSNPWVFLVGLTVVLTLLSGLPACTTASLNLVTPNELRGTGFAFYAGTAGLLAGITGPTLVALFAKLFTGPAAIGYGMAMLIGIGCAIGVACSLYGLGAMRKAIEASERWQS